MFALLSSVGLEPVPCPRALALLGVLAWVGGCDGPRAGAASDLTASDEPDPPVPPDPLDPADHGEGARELPAEPEPPPAYDTWVTVALPGTTCSDGSPYKFFVNWHAGADDLLVVFEPGGACWDYASCSGELGQLGAANPHGIPDDHMNTWGYHSPLVRRDREDNPMRAWNMVFLPYCTGDVHTGSRTVVYVSDDETKQLRYRHVGHDNLIAVSNWLGERFAGTDRLYAGGCSAGGVGSNINYVFLREAIDPARGYLVNDSGPLFPQSINSAPLYQRIRAAWGLDEVVAATPIAGSLDEDFGAINQELADLYPDDRLAVTFFVRDFNFSRYSYERFYAGIDAEGIHAKFYEDTLLLMAQYDGRDNLGYYLPYFRNLNASHCASILDFAGTEIGDWQLGDFVEAVLDDGVPLPSLADLDGALAP